MGAWVNQHEPPSAGIFDDPVTDGGINETWARWILYALDELAQDDFWTLDGTQHAVEQVEFLANRLIKGHWMQVSYGTIWMQAHNDLAPGWVFCDGQSLPVGDYPHLEGILPGTGDDYIVPNLKGRFPIGYDGGASGKPWSSNGGTGGAETVTLTTAQMPNHRHARNPDGTSERDLIVGTSSNRLHATANGNLATADRSFTAFEGGGQAHDNMPPYIALHYVIYVGVPV